MREWPLTLVAAAFFLGAAARYIAADGIDVLSAMLACLGSASFGAWLYAVGTGTTQQLSRRPPDGEPMP